MSFYSRNNVLVISSQIYNYLAYGRFNWQMQAFYRFVVFWGNGFQKNNIFLDKLRIKDKIADCFCVDYNPEGMKCYVLK